MSTNYKNVAVIIPSLNPDEKFVDTVEGLISEGFSNIILVDDGSRKECRCYFEELSKHEECVVLTHSVNKGKGRALKTAFNYYISTYDLNKFAGIITAYADVRHLSKDIAACAEFFTQYPKSLILGTRDFNLKNIPPKIRMENKFTAFVFELLYGKKIHDTRTGLRCIPNSFITECITMPGERFEYEINMLISAVKQKLPIKEVKIDTVYFDDNRKPHFDAVKDSARIYKVIFASFLRFMLSSIFCFAVDQGLFRLFNKVFFYALTAGISIGYSTFFSRLISTLLNYYLKKKVVFKAKERKFSFFVKYSVLCIFQMFASWGGVTALYSLLHIDISFVKVIIDIILFVFSYQIQARWVFNETKKSPDHSSKKSSKNISSNAT